MAPVKVFGSAVFANAARVMACLEEVGVEYDVVEVDYMAKEHKGLEHLARNVCNNTLDPIALILHCIICIWMLHHPFTWFSLVLVDILIDVPCTSTLMFACSRSAKSQRFRMGTSCSSVFLQPYNNYCTSTEIVALESPSTEYSLHLKSQND